jgi:hypothetical protein
MEIKKWKKTIKKQFTGSLKKYTQQLEAELKAVYENPDTIVGKLAQAYQGTQAANQRLSALCACIIKAGGGHVKFTKVELESFKGMAINIKWELPEGVENPKDAESFVFSYDAIPQAELEKQQQAAAAAAAQTAATQGTPPAPDTPGTPPVPATGDSTFVSAENPADTVPSGTAFPDEAPAPLAEGTEPCPIGPPGEAGPAGYIPPVSQ